MTTIEFRAGPDDPMARARRCAWLVECGHSTAVVEAVKYPHCRQHSNRNMDRVRHRLGHQTTTIFQEDHDER